jgi:hypothetical protein
MRATAGALVASLWSVSAAQATALQPMDLTRLAGEARVIAVGRVGEVTAHWVRGGRQIDSLITVDVEAYLKGDLGRRLTLRTPGGQIGPYRSIVPGAPEFAPGDELVLFLDDRLGSFPVVLGLTQGALHVTTDAAGARWVDAPAVSWPADELRFPTRARVSLAELARRVTAILRASATGAPR